jgi:hypothetical protein
MESNALAKLFTTEEQSDLKQAFKEIICEHLKNDLEQMDCYLFDPSVLEDMVHEIIDELRGDMKKILKKKLMTVIENVDIEKLVDFNKEVKS